MHSKNLRKSLVSLGSGGYIFLSVLSLMLLLFFSTNHPQAKNQQPTQKLQDCDSLHILQAASSFSMASAEHLTETTQFASEASYKCLLFDFL